MAGITSDRQGCFQADYGRLADVHLVEVAQRIGNLIARAMAPINTI